MHGIYHLFLQTTAGSGDPSAAIAAAGDKVRNILLALIGAMLGLFAAAYLATHLAGGIFHMWGGFPWASQEHKTAGENLHKRAHEALFHVGVKAPLMIAVVGVVIGIVAVITGFSIPIDWSSVTSGIKK
jgi:hypothetical protein